MSKKKKPNKGGGTKIEKAESVAPLPVGSLLSTERGQPGIVTSSSFLQDTKRRELAMPTRLCTFDTMAEDDAVYTSIDITNLHVVNALYNGEFRAKTPKGQQAAEFLNYCIRNMSFGTWLDVCMNAVTDLKYGFSLANIVTEKRTYGQFAGARCIKKISPRDQKSVLGWLWDKDQREVLGWVQKQQLTQSRSFDTVNWKQGLTALSSAKFYDSIYPIVRTDQTLWCRYNSTNNSPEGDPPLGHCWLAHKEKELISRYETVGVSKDLGGAVVLRVPEELLTRAQAPANYPADATALAALQTNAKALHAGESTHILLSSEMDQSTKTPLYAFKLQGIEGGGKQYSTGEIISRKNRSIYNTFGTGFLLLGQESEGSYALSTNAVTTHGHYVNRNILQKKVVLDTQLAPRMLKVNDVGLDWKDMPEFIPADPNELSLELAGKFVQRTASLGMMTPEALTFLFERAGLPTDGIENLDFSDPKASRAGESKGSSGTGGTQSGGKASDTNMDNKSLNNTAIKDYIFENDKIIDTETGNVVNSADLDDDGNYKE